MAERKEQLQREVLPFLSEHKPALLDRLLIHFESTLINSRSDVDLSLQAFGEGYFKVVILFTVLHMDIYYFTT